MTYKMYNDYLYLKATKFKLIIYCLNYLFS